MSKMTPLYVRERNGDYRPATPKEIVADATRQIGKLFNRNVVIGSPKDCVELLTVKLAHKEHELFAVIFLNTRHQVIAYEEMFRGTVDAAPVYPREIVKAVIRHNAGAVILAHNHPGGDTTPSGADKALTALLKGALALIDVPILDHLIIGDGFFSFAQNGLL